jgi:NADPH-dependent 2,4-dienoyl-CoA reductase/sulfur reductase-like enzyme
MTDSLTVVGGGPAGMELAALCAEAGATVTLHERSDSLGGQLRLAMLAPDQERLATYVEWQARRLRSLGVRVQLGSEVDRTDLLTLPDSEVIAIATGARGRKPDVTGVDLPMVGDARDVLRGTFQPGHRVLIVAEDDHLPPLLVADHLAVRGHHVTMVYSTPAAAVLLGRYISGSILGRLDAAGVTFRYLEKLDSISAHGAVLRHIYSGRKRTCTDYDSVVLACGGVAESGLYQQVRSERSRVHILGDAYAPRRLVFATRQACALADLLTTEVIRETKRKA